MDSDPLRAVASALVDRTALVLFALLTAGWFLPDAYPPLGGTPLIVPSYLVVVVLYDGLLGLEHVAYAAARHLPIGDGVAFEAGLVVTFYLFAVVTVALGRALQRRVGSASSDDARTLGRFGYAVAAGLVVIGLLLAAQGAVIQPTVTSATCTQGSTADGATTTETCTTTTEPATGQQRYIVGLGLGLASLGGGMVAVDRRLARH